MAVAQTTVSGGATVHRPVMTPTHTPRPKPTKRHKSPTLWLAIIAAGATIALTGVTFWLSYEALHDLAAGHHLTYARAWAWPGCIDAFLIVGEVLILRASLLRRIDWLAVFLVALGSVGSIVLNIVSVGAHVDGTTRVVAAVPPVAALLAFTALMRQIYRAIATDEQPPADAVTPVNGPSDEAEPLVIEEQPPAAPAFAMPPMPAAPPSLPAPVQQPVTVQAQQPAPAPIVYSDPRCAVIRALYVNGQRPGTAAMRQALVDAGYGQVSDGMIRGTLRPEVERREPHLVPPLAAVATP